MKTIFYSILCFLVLSSYKIDAQNHEELKSINSEIWTNFTKAYETLDYDLFADIHSDSLIRVSGNSKHIKNKQAYIDGYKKWWKDKSLHHTISFRFLERIYNDGIASERGIYKLTRNPNSEKEKSYYGKFHVIHKKERGKWKILVDYDSDENESINESSYLSAHKIDDFHKF